MKSIRLTLITVDQIKEVIRISEARSAMVDQRHFELADGIKMEALAGTDAGVLRSYLEGLSPGAKAELMALAWLGEGRIGQDGSRWRELLLEALQNLLFDMPSLIAANANLHGALRSGLAMIKAPS